jgi:hypothetical protein
MHGTRIISLYTIYNYIGVHDAFFNFKEQQARHLLALDQPCCFATTTSCIGER